MEGNCKVKPALIYLALLLVLVPKAATAFTQPIIIDHTCTDITKIPDTWISQVKSNLKLHYAHTSHGEQISVGLERLANANSSYPYYPDNCNMPQTTSYMSMMEGQYSNGYCETYVTPDLYWESSYGQNLTRDVLSRFDVNVSMWAWCSQLDYYSQAATQAYLDEMSRLESEYPNITFVYMTGNAQSGEENRYERNNQIREYCRNNNKVLYDFADLDAWYNGQQYTEGGIPMEHPQYHGDQAGHTTYESTENKAKAFWWLMARIAGWDGEETIQAPVITLDKPSLSFRRSASGNAPPPQTFFISSNEGSGTLSWSITDNTSWLSISPTSGNDSKTISVSVDSTGLESGTYTGTITVSAPQASNSPLSIPVIFRNSPTTMPTTFNLLLDHDQFP